MFSLKIDTPLLCLSIVLINLIRSACLHSPPDVEVLNPSEFNIILPPDQNGTLVSIRISINKPLGFNNAIPEYSRAEADGQLIHFSERSLNLKKGDKIYYSAQFSDGNGGTYGQAGIYVFDGVYKGGERHRREVKEDTSEEISEEQRINEDSANEPIGRQLRHGHGHYSPQGEPHGHYVPHGQPHGHYSPHGPSHGHHDRHHFGAPSHGSPHGPPPFPGPGPWSDHGYDNKDSPGSNRPWEGHGGYDDDGNCDHPKHPDGSKDRNNKKPWESGSSDNPYSGSNNNNGNKGFDYPYDDKKPGRGSGFGNSNPDVGSKESGDSGRSDGKNNRGTEDPNVEVFTTRRPSSTTQRTTTTPNIDIRFRLPDDK